MATPAELAITAAELADTYATLRRANALRAETEEQTDVLALLTIDLQEFCRAGASLARAGHWGAAFSFARLISERAEYLLAAHESDAFARTFWKRAESLAEDEGLAQIRSGEARTHVRRLGARRTTSDRGDDILKRFIQMHDIQSYVVHPSAVGAAITANALENPAGSEAETAADTLLTSVWLALVALSIVVEERCGRELTVSAREHLARVRNLRRADASL